MGSKAIVKADLIAVLFGIAEIGARGIGSLRIAFQDTEYVQRLAASAMLSRQILVGVLQKKEKRAEEIWGDVASSAARAVLPVNERVDDYQAFISYICHYKYTMR